MNINDLPAQARRERLKRGWTQADVAEKAHVATRTYQSFETRKGNPQGENLRAILNALDISDDGMNTALATREDWPRDIGVLLDTMGAYLATFEEADREPIIYDLTRHIFARRS